MAAVSVTRLQPPVAWLRRACFRRRSSPEVPRSSWRRWPWSGARPTCSASAFAAATLTVWLVVVGRERRRRAASCAASSLVSVGVYVLELVGLFVVPASIPDPGARHARPPRVRGALPGPVASVRRLRRRRRRHHRLRRGGGGRAGWASGCRLRHPLRARGAGRRGRHPARPVPARAVGPDGQRPARRGAPRRSDRPAQPDPLHRPPRARHGACAAQVGVRGWPCRSTTAVVVYLDIDGFKDINDRHGHGHGDAVLRAVGRPAAADARSGRHRRADRRRRVRHPRRGPRRACRRRRPRGAAHGVDG